MSTPVSDSSARVLRHFERLRFETFITTLLFLPLLPLLLFWKLDQTLFPVLSTERWGILILIPSLVFLKKKIKNPWHFLTLTYLFTLGILASHLVGFYGVPELRQALRRTSLESLACLFSFILFLELRFDFTKALKIAALVMTLGALFRLFSGTPPWYEVPFLHNPSMAATFVVLASSLHPLLSLLMIALTHSWTAALVLAVGLLYEHRRLLGPWCWVCVVEAPFLLYAWLGRLPDHGRIEIWGQALHLWAKAGVKSLVFGMGLGTTRVWLPYANFESHVGDEVNFFYWMHNDWIQILVELGALGLLLSLISTGVLFQKAQEEKTKALILAFSGAMLTNFPLHYALTALVGWNLVGRVLQSDSKNAYSEIA